MVLDQKSLGAKQAEPAPIAEIVQGNETLPEHFELGWEYFLARDITLATIQAAGIEVVANAHDALDPEFAPAPAIYFPYTTLDGEPDWIDGRDTQFYRVRYLREPAVQSFVKRKAPRFQQLKDSGVHIYLPPTFDWHTIAADPSKCVVVTEGECKALSASQHEVPAIGLGGVDCIWQRIDDQHREFHPVLAAFSWGGRETAIVFDSDVTEKPNVMAAEERLIKELVQRGAVVRRVRLPAGGLQ